MARAKYQVLVLPFCLKEDEIKYCIFHRSDMNIWQFIAGGGEDGETPLQSAKREAYEEAGISYDAKYYSLDTCCSISTECFAAYRKTWGDNCFVIPEYTFAVNIEKTIVNISPEHTQYEWMDYETAKHALRYDSNKAAIWELDNKIKKGLLVEENTTKNFFR